MRFSAVEVLSRTAPAEILPIEAVREIFPEARCAIENAMRPPVCMKLDLTRPAVMAVLNVTPDSFSDGDPGRTAAKAVEEGLALIEAGADILDIGGESTRPGATPVSVTAELDRVLPVIEGLTAAGCEVPISIDTRNARVAKAARRAGARLFNDVSALSHDPESPHSAVDFDAVCLMHARGDPRTMQDDPRYDDVLLDVFDYLETRVAEAVAAGVEPGAIMIDPGIGFGKTVAHNLALLRGLALFRTLPAVVLLGVSRKGFIGKLSGEADAKARVPGSIAAGLQGLAQGAQVLRVHDVAETVQAVRVWQAMQEDA